MTETKKPNPNPQPPNPAANPQQQSSKNSSEPSGRRPLISPTIQQQLKAAAGDLVREAISDFLGVEPKAGEPIPPPAGDVIDAEVSEHTPATGVRGEHVVPDGRGGFQELERFPDLESVRLSADDRIQLADVFFRLSTKVVVIGGQRVNVTDCRDFGDRLLQPLTNLSPLVASWLYGYTMGRAQFMRGVVLEHNQAAYKLGKSYAAQVYGLDDQSTEAAESDDDGPNES